MEECGVWLPCFITGRTARHGGTSSKRSQHPSNQSRSYLQIVRYVLQPPVDHTKLSPRLPFNLVAFVTFRFIK